MYLWIWSRQCLYIIKKFKMSSFDWCIVHFPTTNQSRAIGFQRYPIFSIGLHGRPNGLKPGQWQTVAGPGYPFLWGHPVVPIYGDISKNRHITAYGKDANILEYPIFVLVRRNAPWQRQPRANWKTYLTIVYNINVSFKGTMHFVDYFHFENLLPWITPGRFHFVLMTSYPKIVLQNWRGVS